MTCLSAPQITGVTFDGGYAEYMTAPAMALALIPDGLSPVDAAPLMCAGLTTFNSLRNSGARAGDTVAVLGLGGLGHLAVQFAAKMGFRTIGIARGRDKESLVRELGATQYIDSQSQDVVAELTKLGGARVILATAPSGKAMSEVVDGLGVDGKLIAVGVSPDPIQVNPVNLLMRRRSILGWPSGTAADSQDTLFFSMLTGVRAMTEVFPLERTAEAFELMMSGKVRFRAVLKIAN
jgi:D-arabinose 1-dehydrogenase-like Zn-dependent alcohol dehydrogenase